jgi:hypothetical protein
LMSDKSIYAKIRRVIDVAAANRGSVDQLVQDIKPHVTVREATIRDLVRFCIHMGLVTETAALTRRGRLGLDDGRFPGVVTLGVGDYLKRSGLDIRKVRSVMRTTQIPTADNLYRVLFPNENGLISAARFRRCLLLLSQAGELDAQTRKCYLPP